MKMAAEIKDLSNRIGFVENSSEKEEFIGIIEETNSVMESKFDKIENVLVDICRKCNLTYPL